MAENETPKIEITWTPFTEYWVVDDQQRASPFGQVDPENVIIGYYPIGREATSVYFTAWRYESIKIDAGEPFKRKTKISTGNIFPDAEICDLETARSKFSENHEVVQRMISECHTHGVINRRGRLEIFRRNDYTVMSPSGQYDGPWAVVARHPYASENQVDDFKSLMSSSPAQP